MGGTPQRRSPLGLVRPDRNRQAGSILHVGNELSAEDSLLSPSPAAGELDIAPVLTG